jgi:hypothetical protein
MTFEHLAARLQAEAVRVQRLQSAEPLVGSADVSLAAALDRFHAAEQQLDHARELCRVAARKEGKRTSSIFADAGSTFITRETGEKWVGSVREEMRDEVKAAHERGFREGQLASFRAAHTEETPATLAQKIVLAGDRRRGEAPLAPDTIVREPFKGATIDPQKLAQQIVAAGKKARWPRED